MTDINTSNDHFVGVLGNKVSILLPPVQPMDIDEALRLAAWIVCVAVVHEPAVDERFTEILEAVRNS